MRIAVYLLLLIIAACAEPEARVLEEQQQMTLSSIAFNDNGMIPAKYTCDGEGINPPLTVTGLPKDAKSMALIIDDPDSPSGTWDHWVLWNINPTEKIEEDSIPGIEGLNSWGKHDYGGPCPPSGTHSYVFKVYALDTKLAISENSGKIELEGAMQGHIMAKAELIGLYQ